MSSSVLFPPQPLPLTYTNEIDTKPNLNDETMYDGDCRLYVRMTSMVPVLFHGHPNRHVGRSAGCGWNEDSQVRRYCSQTVNYQADVEYEKGMVEITPTPGHLGPAADVV